MILDATDRRIIEATQAGLPLAPAPYAERVSSAASARRPTTMRLA
jgi:hypothetical protein